ncbi:MAG: hypothetical protein WB822_22510, partial [Rhodoplanes sp.]
MAERPSNPAGTPPSPSNEPPGDDVRPRRDGEASTAGTKPANAAAQAEDLDKVRGAVVGSADMARNVWVLFLSFGTYLAIAVGSVTHHQLLVEKPIRLPLLNVELPLVAFFLVAPLLFLIFHIYRIHPVGAAGMALSELTAPSRQAARASGIGLRQFHGSSAAR